MVPDVVSFEADTVPAGMARDSKMLSKNKPDSEMDLSLPLASMTLGLRRVNLTIGTKRIIE